MPQLKTVQRWDLLGMSLIALLGMVLVFLLDGLCSGMDCKAQAHKNR
jgi:hypothetical protein